MKYRSALSRITTCLCLFVAFSAVATPGIFLESAWQNNLANDGAAIWAGGNVSAIGDAPHSSNGFFLMESALGQMTSQTLGYPGAAVDLATSADVARANANAYRYAQGPVGTVTNPAVAWTLVFSGGFNPISGANYPSGVTATYDPRELDEAEYFLRALLRASPLDVDAARKLVLLTQDRMIPFEFSGTLALAYATKSRLLGQNAALREIPAIQIARTNFVNACNAFSSFLGNPADAALAEGLVPLLSVGVTNEVARVVDGYLRNLARFAQSTFADLQLRNFADFRDPARSPLPQGLLGEINSAQNDVQLRLLLASPFQNLPTYAFSEAGRVQNFVRDIGRLYESIVLGRITFITGNSSQPSDNSALGYGEFTTSFVPIFSGLPTTAGNSSFDVALSLAEDFVGDARPLETEARNAIDLILQRQYDYRVAQQNLQQQYLSELVNLCGYANIDDQGNPFPDAFFAALEPRERENIGRAILEGNYNLEVTGTLYQQWNLLKQAETGLELAAQQLTNTFSEMLQRQLVATTIASNQTRIATLILSNGQLIAGIELKKGEIEAEIALQIARVQAELAKKKAQTAAFVGTLGTIADAIKDGGTLSFSRLADSATVLANGYQDAAASMQIGNIQARSARQLADLSAQVTKIVSAERTAIQYEQADETLLRLSEDLNSLRLQADSQNIQIRLATQQVDQERAKLANMLARVAYLLRQWSRSVNLLSQNPQLSNDLLVDRDVTIQRAEDAFVLAQQWAFLTAQTFYYKYYCPDAANTRFVERILAARNATDLSPILNEMKSYIVLGTAGCQSSPQFTAVHFSLRNNVFQFNKTQGEGTNTVYLGFEPVLIGGSVGTNAAASRAAWTDVLIRSLKTNQFGNRVLVLDFGTTLALQRVTGVQRNPLFQCANFATTLYSGPDNSGGQLRGVEISVTTEGFQFPQGANAGFSVRLAQAGTSVIRGKGFGCSTVGATSTAFRYYNFGFFSVQGKAGANSLDASGAFGAFKDRSPANDSWQLVIDEGDSPNNAALLANLGKLADIELRFGILSFIDQCAAQACSQ